jgi:phosphohistidine phosphatase
VPHGTDGVAEDERPLTSDGREKTIRAARGIRALDLGIDAVFSSRLPRALDTARILSKALKLPDPQIAEELLPGAGPADLVALLRSSKADVPVVVGHEPGLTEALAHLLGQKEGTSYLLKKAGFAAVDLGTLGPRPHGALRLLLTPAVLRALGR